MRLLYRSWKSHLPPTRLWECCRTSSRNKMLWAGLFCRVLVMYVHRCFVTCLRCTSAPTRRCKCSWTTFRNWATRKRLATPRTTLSKSTLRPSLISTTGSARYVAVCCSVLQCVAVCCSVLRFVAALISTTGSWLRLFWCNRTLLKVSCDDSRFWKSETKSVNFCWQLSVSFWVFDPSRSLLRVSVDIGMD